MPSKVTKGKSFLAFSGFWWLLVFFGSGQKQLNFCLHLSCHLLQFLPVFSPPVSLVRTLDNEFRTHLGNPAWPHLEIIIAFAKVLFPNKVTFSEVWGIGYEHNFEGATIQFTTDIIDVNRYFKQCYSRPSPQMATKFVNYLLLVCNKIRSSHQDVHQLCYKAHQ